MNQLAFFIIIAILLVLLVRQSNAAKQSETYYELRTNIGDYEKSVKKMTQVQPKEQLTETGAGDKNLLYSSTLFQGAVHELKPNEEVEFLAQQPGEFGAIRIWKYKSLKKGQFKIVKFTAYLQKTADKAEEKLVVYAEPRYGSVPDLEAYINEDPKLANVTDGLAFDPTINRAINYTITIV
jgi:hypothetical protein